MKKFLYASVLAAGCTTAALAAQAGMADQAKSKEAMAKDAAKSVTVTGCVAEADGQFMLNNATMAEGGPAMAYSLTGGTLKPHVGHKVAVTGMMKPMAMGDMKGTMGAKPDTMKPDTMKPDTMKPDAAKADAMKKGAAMTHGSVAVESVKMIAATCS